MPVRGENFSKGEYYHIFNRGVNKEQIFFSSAHYLYCLKLVSKYALKYHITIIAYCLMPNHYHFLVRQDDDISVSKFIGLVFNAYVQGINRLLNRSGALFEGRFKHVHVEDESYLVYICRYIHLNPVSAGLVKQPELWPYSNCREWLGTRNGTLIDREFENSYFENQQGYLGFIKDDKDEMYIEKYQLD